jgi:transcriptional regulator with XRE-family HTH domain
MTTTPTPRLNALLRRVSVRLDAQGHGSRAELARRLGVSRQHMDKWLVGEIRPNGEMTLALQEWLRHKH